MSKNEINKLIALMMSLSTNDYYNYENIILDETVNDCLMNLYFSMLTQDEVEREKQYNEFEKKYLELNTEQKEIVNVEVAKLLDIEYKPKVKKKEKRRDE